MDIATFHASRRFADVKSGRIAYVELGEGTAALFIHGVPLNGYHWRHVVSRLRHRRRCIAIDLMGLGYTEISPSQDVSFTSQAHMVRELIDALGIAKIDLIANDSGGAIAQIFAAHQLEGVVREHIARDFFGILALPCRSTPCSYRLLERLRISSLCCCQFGLKTG